MINQETINLTLKILLALITAGGAITLCLRFRITKKDSNAKNNVHQQAISNDKVNQAGRDLNVK